MSKCTSIPSLSNIVLKNDNVKPLRQKPPKSFVYLWKKADISGMEDDIQQFSETFTSEFSVNIPINSPWVSFKTKSLSLISNNVHSKMTSSRYSQSWCNRTVYLISRWKSQAFQEARQNSNRKGWARYKTFIQKSCKEECRRAYNNNFYCQRRIKLYETTLLSKLRNVTAQVWPH